MSGQRGTKSLLGEKQKIGVRMRPLSTLFLSTRMLAAAYAEDWPQWQGAHRNGEWNESGLIEKFPAEGAKILWRTPINLGYSGPSAVNGKVYVFDFTPNGDSAAEIGKRASIKGEERLLCLNAADGKPLWQHKYACEYTMDYPNGPRATPTEI